MTKQILKTVVAGILAGTALFLIPFLLMRILLFVLLIGIIAHLSGRRRSGRGMQLAFAERIRHMSEEEWTAYRQKYNNRCRYNARPATETKS